MFFFTIKFNLYTVICLGLDLGKRYNNFTEVKNKSIVKTKNPKI